MINLIYISVKLLCYRLSQALQKDSITLPRLLGEFENSILRLIALKTADGNFVEDYMDGIKEPEEGDPPDTPTKYKDTKLRNHSQAVTDAFRRCVK